MHRTPHLFLLLVFVATAATASVTFVSPLDGAQAVGPTLLEVTTTATSVDRVEFYVDGTLAGVGRKAPWRIAHDFGASPASHEIVAKVLANGYRTSESARVLTAALTAGETMNVDLVELALRIHAPRDVRASDLRVTENGLEQTIRSLRAEREAARFVFVLDRSLSMSAGKFAAALRAIDAQSKLFRRDDRIEVVLFNHNVTKPRAIVSGEKVATIFGDVAPSGGTSLRDALASVASRERTYAIVITDGSDRNSALSDEEALRRISGTKTTIDAITFGTVGSSFLRRAVSMSGGTLSNASAEHLNDALHWLLTNINSRYTLSYQSSGTTVGWRHVRVTSRTRGIDVANDRKDYFAR